MPGGFPFGFDLCNAQSVGADLTASQGTALTAPGSNNTKAAYTQLIASTTYDSCFMIVAVQVTCPPNTAHSGAVDVAIGAGGSEVVIISNLIVQSVAGAESAAGNGGLSVGYFTFPISIAAGTRIAARYQASVFGTTSTYCSVILFDGAFTQIEGCAGVDTIGFQSSVTLGTAVNPGVTTNTKGAYFQLTASSTQDYCGFVAAFDTQNNQPFVNGYLVDIAIGAAASEIVILPNFALWTGVFNASEFVAGNQLVPQTTPFIPISIPSGTRIAARCASQQASNTMGVTFYGVYQ